MIPGPTIIKTCSKCEGLIEENSITSGNTFGATFWTDGKRYAPMLPDTYWIVKCPHCSEPLWLDELDKVGEKEIFDDNDIYKNSKSYKKLGFLDYIEILKAGDLEEKKERYLRLHAWWEGNNKRRKGKNVNLSTAEIDNLIEFQNMLDLLDDNDRLMMAEVNRELSQFDDAKKLLEKPFAKELSQAVSIILQLIKVRDPYVAEMKY